MYFTLFSKSPFNTIFLMTSLGFTIYCSDHLGESSLNFLPKTVYNKVWSVATYEFVSPARTSQLSCRLPNSTDLMYPKLNSGYPSPVNQIYSSPSFLYLSKWQFHFPWQWLTSRILESTLTLFFILHSMVNPPASCISSVFKICLHDFFLLPLLLALWCKPPSLTRLLKNLLTVISASALTPSVFNIRARVILLKYDLNHAIP